MRQLVALHQFSRRRRGSCTASAAHATAQTEKAARASGHRAASLTAMLVQEAEARRRTRNSLWSMAKATVSCVLLWPCQKGNIFIAKIAVLLCGAQVVEISRNRRGQPVAASALSTRLQIQRGDGMRWSVSTWYIRFLLYTKFLVAQIGNL